MVKHEALIMHSKLLYITVRCALCVGGYLVPGMRMRYGA